MELQFFKVAKHPFGQFISSSMNYLTSKGIKKNMILASLWYGNKKNINGNIPKAIFKSSDEIQFWDTVSITRQRELLYNAVLLCGPADVAGSWPKEKQEVSGP